MIEFFVQEDIVVKLIEFLEAPHATSDELLADKELVGCLDFPPKILTLKRNFCFSHQEMRIVIFFPVMFLILYLLYVDQSSKGKKRKRVSKGSGSATGSTPSKSSAKVLTLWYKEECFSSC